MEKNNNVKYDVFISYRKRFGGWQIARLIYEALKKEGINPFIDMENITAGDYIQQLKDAIKQCNYVVIVLTKDSLDKTVWCYSRGERDFFSEEIELAKKLNKPICPVFTQDFACPKNLPPNINFIGKMHGLQINEWNWADVVSHIATAVDKEKEKIIKEKMNINDNCLYPLFIRKGIYYIVDFNDKKINTTLLKKYKQCIIDTFGVKSTNIKILHIDLAKQSVKAISLKEKK